MLEEYRTVYEGGQGEIIEKKSRFIATVRRKKRRWLLLKKCGKNTGTPPITALPM